MTDPVSEFLDADGGWSSSEPIADKLAAGDPVRFRADGDKPGRRNGWAWLHLDGVPAGVFRHYRWACGRCGARGAIPVRCHQPNGARSWLRLAKHRGPAQGGNGSQAEESVG